MKAWLNSGNDGERIQKLVSLGVSAEAAKGAGTTEVTWQLIRSKSDVATAILFLPCGELSTSSLHLVKKTARGWEVSDSVPLDCHYDDSVSVETAPLRNQELDDVVVHHDCKEHGTGLVQQDFEVFAVRSSKFKRIADAEEALEKSGWPGVPDVVQRSSFALIPATASATGKIEETLCSTSGGKLTIQKRHFDWSDAQFHFVPSPLVRVQATDEKFRAACQGLENR